MTKREFYERFRGDGPVYLNDIVNFISEMELYDYMDFFDEYTFSEYVWETINNWQSEWEALRDWLGGLDPCAEYYMRRDYDDPESVGESDVPWILNELEEIMENNEDDWEADGNPPTSSIAEPQFVPPLLDFQPDESMSGSIFSLT